MVVLVGLADSDMLSFQTLLEVMRCVVGVGADSPAFPCRHPSPLTFKLQSRRTRRVEPPT
jgi:hypothetical protein